MAENEPNPGPSKENVQTPIDPDEAAAAIKEVSEAMAILPKRRFGCLGRTAKYGAVLLVLFGVFVYWNFLRTPRLRISKETTHIIEPLTSDGTRVDYIAALEQDYYPPEMKTDNNGYRLIIRALGAAADDGSEGETSSNTEARSAEIHEKLGLDPAIEPTITYQEPWDYLKEYGERLGVEETRVSEWYERLHEPSAFDDLPMMAAWLAENVSALDLLGKAARKPVFCMPMIRTDETAMFAATSELQRMRSFARSLLTRCNYRIATGDIDGAMHDLITCKRLGRHVRHQRLGVGGLMGIAIEGIADSIRIAATRESQPTEEQLRRLVDELKALPPRQDLDEMLLAERYNTLDCLQAMAHGEQSLDDLFSDWEVFETLELGVAASLSVDWNIVLRWANAEYDDLDRIEVWQPPRPLSLSDLFIGVRSRRVADCVARLYAPGRATREANRRSNCCGNLHRITLAMLIYERRHGTLPPAYTVDAAGNPLHSWRVLLLPYLGEDELYGKLRLDEPWDSEHNRRFHDADLAIYRCPSAELTPGRNTYSVVVGEKTPFQAAKGKSLDDFGMNLILVV